MYESLCILQAIYSHESNKQGSTENVKLPTFLLSFLTNGSK